MKLKSLFDGWPCDECMYKGNPMCIDYEFGFIDGVCTNALRIRNEENTKHYLEDQTNKGEENE